MMVSNLMAFPLIFVAGFLIRLLLICNDSLASMFANRVEVSTPISSWKRAIEGVELMNRNISPYMGDVYHESPLMLPVYKQILLSNQVALVFVICDLLTAAILSLAAYIYLKSLAEVESKVKSYPNSAQSLLIKADKIQSIPFYVASVYLFCPYLVSACCGKSTGTFLNLVTSVFVLLSSSGYLLMASIVLGALSYHSIYHICLLAPLILFAYKPHSEKKRNVWNSIKVFSYVSTALAVMGSLLSLSQKTTGSWKFLESTYGFMLSVPDLTPNIGLFWYFFTEMFEHFRVFFLWTFQLNAFIYTVPLSIRLRNEPMLLLFVHLTLIPLFKSYPCIGDVGFYLAFLPMFQHLFPFMRQSFLVGCIFVSCSLLAPTLWHLWIYSGSANANFYFAITLAFNTGQIFLLTDILSGYIKREYYLEKGVELDEEGKLKPLRLQ